MPVRIRNGWFGVRLVHVLEQTRRAEDLAAERAKLRVQVLLGSSFARISGSYLPLSKGVGPFNGKPTHRIDCPLESDYSRDQELETDGRRAGAIWSFSFCVLKLLHPS